MKNTKPVIFLLICILLAAVSASVSAQYGLAAGPACICLDEYGMIYTETALEITPEIAVCHACTEGVCTPLELTLMQCRTLNAAALKATEAAESPEEVPPTKVPTAVPTQVPPTEIPTAVPTQVSPTEIPTAVPTQVPPTEIPTAVPTQVPPTEIPTAVPTQVPPTEIPTAVPTEDLTEDPTEELTEEPAEIPAKDPTEEPSEEPAEEPTEKPTEDPTEEPTEKPTEDPTEEPTEKPTEAPTEAPTEKPTEKPTEEPTPLPAPAAPIQECPVGRYKVRSLGFYWAPSEYAETYTVEWNNDRNQKGSITLSNTDPTCKKGRCIAYTSLPGVGKYVWTVTAKNSSGSARSKAMSFEIVTNVSTPTPYLPNSTIFNHTYPSFQWEDVRDGVTEYRIQIVGKYDNRIRYDRWFDVNDIYIGNGVCYVQTNLFLPAGSYSWRVLGCNEDFCSRWSYWLDFYVECDYCNYNNTYYGNYANTVPSTSYPTAVIQTFTPEFQWRTLTGASYYIVRLSDQSGKQLFERQVPSSNCTVEMCTWDPSYKLPGNGSYSWTVSGYGANGGLWGSSTGSFTVQAEIKMDPLTFVSPEQNGYLSQDAPMIIWTDPGEVIVLSSVEIFSDNNESLLKADLDRDQAWCDGTTCAVAFRSIPDGKYRITVTPVSEYNTIGETVGLVFNKGGRLIGLKSPKNESTVQPRPLFRWVLDGGAKEIYELTLKGVDNNMTVTYSGLTCGSNNVTCEDGEAFYAPAEPLPAGIYSVTLSIPGSETVCEALEITVE